MSASFSHSAILRLNLFTDPDNAPMKAHSKVDRKKGDAAAGPFHTSRTNYHFPLNERATSFLKGATSE